MKINKFKNYWKQEISKGLFDVGRMIIEMQANIRDAFISGKSEIDIVNGIILQGTYQSGKPFTTDMIDKIRHIVLVEKIKLKEKNLI